MDFDEEGEWYENEIVEMYYDISDFMTLLLVVFFWWIVLICAFVRQKLRVESLVVNLVW